MVQVELLEFSLKLYLPDISTQFPHNFIVVFIIVFITVHHCHLHAHYCVLSPSRNCVLHPAASPQHLTSLSSHCWSQMKSSRGRVGVGTQKPGHSWKDQRPKYLFQIHRFGHNASPTSGSVISYLKEKIISTMFGAGKLISRHSIPLHWNEY